MNKKTLIKSIFILFLGTTMTSINGHSQGMYASFNLGYNLKSGAQSISTSNTTTAFSDITEAFNLSLGKGIQATGAFGYILSDNITAELGVSYLVSSKQAAIDSDITRPRIRTEEYSGTMIKVNPAVIFNVPLEGSIQPYAKFGVILGFGNTRYKFINNDISRTRLNIIEWKYSGGIGLGLNSGFGANYSLNDKMKFFGELNITSLNYAPKRGELVTATTDGVDQLPSLNTREKEIIFVDQLDNNVNISNANPDQDLRMKLPYGSAGINVGIKISL